MAYKNVEDRKAYHREWYIKNRTKRIMQIYLHRKKKKDAMKVKILEYLKSHPCVDCGESDPIVLEFDHERDKVANIAIMLRDILPWKVIKNEINKCSVRCANCHRRKTIKGTYKDITKIQGSIA